MLATQQVLRLLVVKFPKPLIPLYQDDDMVEEVGEGQRQVT